MKSEAFRVTVVIPVYNAAAYVRRAVESALSQPETAEVILIEDSSPDQSLQICEELALQYERVRLLRHPDGKNRGASASRNVGIRNARCDFIAFLDADDFYLPGRFSVARALCELDSSIDGVYEAIGVHFETERAKQDWLIGGYELLTTMSKRVAHAELFESQSPIGRSGYTHLDGLVVKRSVFKRTGLFDEHLLLHEDTAMFMKLAALCKMTPGRLDEPVAMRGVHDFNRISAKRSAEISHQDRLLMWRTMWEWGEMNLSGKRRQVIARRYIDWAGLPNTEGRSGFSCRIQSLTQLFGLARRHPSVIGNYYLWVRFGLVLNPFSGLATALRRRLRKLPRQVESR